MKHPSQMSRTATLTEGALMVALAFVLSILPIPSLPWGGTITVASTLPIILMSLRHGAKWGVLAAAVYGALQLLLGMENVVAVPVQSVFNMVLCAALDYVAAYTVLGFTGAIAGRFKNHTAGLAAGIATTGLLRLLCSFLSGLLIWGAYAWEGWPVWLYSLTYNTLWCLPDIAIVLVAALLLSRVSVLGLLQRPETLESAA